MTAERSHADPEARAATIAEFDYIGRRAVAQIVDHYAHELRLQRLRENPRVMRLASLPVGRAVFWEYGSHTKRGYRYLQSVDRDRAREVLKDPHARWKLSERDGMLVVKRIR